MKTILLSETSGKKSQNLHFMRFVAALMVIISHSFVFSKGNLFGEWFVELTKSQLTMGAFAVAVFFLCGGYLISMSMEKSKTAGTFFEARLIRLIPPLFFVTFLVTLMGGFITSLSPIDYYTSPSTWKYMLNSILVLTHNLPGVFANNIGETSVNGALWTLPLEFVCYILCFVAYKLGFMNKKRFLFSIPLVCIGTAGVWVIGKSIPILSSVIQPVLLFYIGMGYWIYREHIKLSLKYMFIAVVIMIILLSFRLTLLAMLLCFPYIMMTIWFGLGQCSSKIGQLGNYSYGIYLWGCPVQQTIVHFMGGQMNPYLNFLLAIPIATLLGGITYELSENRFFKWYKNVRGK